jgi:opacity protein-like surface antigen
MRIAAFVVTLIAAAGSAGAQQLTIGVHGGVNLARPETEDGADSGLATLPVLGASAELGFAGQLGLRVEIEYLRRGGKVTVIPPGQPPTETEYSLTYLALPVNLRYDAGSGAFAAYGFVGTTFGALLAANQRRSGGDEEDVSDELAGLDVTFDLGAGIGWRVTPAIAVLVDGRYSLGLIETARDDAVLATASWKARDIKVTLGVTYTFGAAPAAPPMSMPLPPSFMPAGAPPAR